jgi:hypothetical protein
MPRYFTQASLASHLAVEIGDIIHPPGMQAGKVISLDDKEIVLGVPPEAPAGNLHTVPEGCGIVMMDTFYLRQRPPGVVDHGT